MTQDRATPNPLEVLGQTSMFADLDDAELKLVFSRTQARPFRKDTVILTENDPAAAVYIISRGQVKISSLSDDGREVILGMLGEGDFFGEIAVLDGLQRSANVVGMSEGEVMVLSSGDFLDILVRQPVVSLALLRELAARLRKADEQIKSLSLEDATGKVAAVLLRLAQDIGRIKRGRVEIDALPLQQDMANMAGTSRETISRVLQAFGREGMIERDGPKLIILDFQKFKDQYC